MVVTMAFYCAGWNFLSKLLFYFCNCLILHLNSFKLYSVVVFCRRGGDARFTYLDASDIHRQINRQECGNVLSPVQVVEQMACELLRQFSLLQHSYHHGDKYYYTKKYLHIIRICFGMSFYSKAEVTRAVLSYAQACFDLGGRTEEAMELLEQQVIV